MRISQPSPCIALMASSGNNTSSEQIDQVVAAMQQWNLTVHADKNYLCEPRSPKERADYWLEKLSSKDYDYFWLIRGGEGTADMIPYLHQHAKKIKTLPKKPILGMSDITALLVYMSQHYDWPCIYMANAIEFSRPKRLDRLTYDAMHRLLHGQYLSHQIDHLTALNQSAIHLVEQQCSLVAPLCIGNMTLLNISIGDIWEFDARDKILLIEDWHEKGYAIARTLKYFQRIGKLDSIQALVLGDFVYDLAYRTEQVALEVEQIDKALHQFAQCLSAPVFKTGGFGHGRRQMPLQCHHTLTLCF